MTKLYLQDQPNGFKLFAPDQYICEVTFTDGIYKMVFFSQGDEFKIKPPQDYETWDEFKINDLINYAIIEKLRTTAKDQEIIGSAISATKAKRLESLIKETLEVFKEKFKKASEAYQQLKK